MEGTGLIDDPAVGKNITLPEGELLVEIVPGSTPGGLGPTPGSRTIWWAFWSSKSGGPCSGPNLVGFGWCNVVGPVVGPLVV